MTALSTRSIAFLAMTLFFAGCTREKPQQSSSTAIDPAAPKVTLAQLIADPTLYEGKDVVVEGMFAGACPDGDFYFKDKFDIIEAYPPNNKIFDLENGTRIRLYGLVKVRRSSAPEQKEKETAEKSEVEVKITGKAWERI